MLQVLESVKAARPQASTEKEEAQTVSSPSLLATIRVTQSKFKVDDFIDIQPNPRQRDTERHLQKALKKHFRKASPTHRRVNVASLVGVLYKVDGHTRALAWQLGLLERPDSLNADVYHCKTIEEVKELYSHFDTPDQMEDTPDRTSGALREAGIVLKSPMLRQYKFAGALRAASRCFGGAECADVYTNVREFAEEIKLLDTIEPSADLFKVGVTAGAVIALRKHGDKILPFFDRYNQNLGRTADGEGDAVAALRETVLAKKGKSGFSQTIELASKVISTCETFLVDGRYVMGKSGPKALKKSKMAGYLKNKRKLAA